jgi:transposase
MEVAIWRDRATILIIRKVWNSEGDKAMSIRQSKVSYWQDAPMPREQLVLFAETLEERIPEDHPVRLLDEILEKLDWNKWESEYHGRAGQPPIHPSVMCKVLLFAMIRRIRSSRQMEYNVRHSVDFIWLTSGRQIDHTTLSEFRRKYPDQLKSVYRQVVTLAVKVGVAKLSELCIDGTRVLANASRYKTLKTEKVEKLLAELEQQISTAMEEINVNDRIDSVLEDDEQSADKLPESLRDMQTRQKLLQEALATLKDMEAQRKKEGIDPKKNPAQLPVSDHDSRILPNKEGGYAPNYTPMAVTETMNGFIVGADVLIGNIEHTVMLTMIDGVESDYRETVETVMADTAYSTGTNLQATEGRGIEMLSPSVREEPKDNPAKREDPSQPVPDDEVGRLPINAQSKVFDKHAFIYDEVNDRYYCPAGKILTKYCTETVEQSGTTFQRTRYRCHDCVGCPIASRCRPNPESALGRQVTRDGFEGVRERHQQRMGRDENKERYKRRQHIGETPFAVLKSAMDLRRFLLCGIQGVQQEWLWGCTGFNLKKLMTMWETVRAQLNETEMRVVE